MDGKEVRLNLVPLPNAHFLNSDLVKIHTINGRSLTNRDKSLPKEQKEHENQRKIFEKSIKFCEITRLPLIKDDEDE